MANTENLECRPNAESLIERMVLALVRHTSPSVGLPGGKKHRH